MAIDENENRQNRRILVIDDNPAIHEDFRKILCRNNSAPSLEEDEAALFGATAELKGLVSFHLDAASQGQEGLEKVRIACAEGNPYALAFVDIRMPPGWDGVETISRIWKICPELQVVICTAYSDYSWEEIFRKVGQNDSLLILKKPFDNVEVLQMAHAMTRKWVLNQQARDHFGQLNRIVHERTVELRDANDGLTRTIRQLETAMERANKHSRDADSANRAKDALLSDLGSELRSSLPSITQLTEQLLAGSLNATQRHQAEAIQLNCKALVEFASRVLKAPRFEAGPSDNEEGVFDVREIVSQVANLCSAQGERSQRAISVEIDNSVPNQLAGDVIRLRHTLSELVELCAEQNRSTRVRIGVREDETFNDRHTIRFSVVSDEGESDLQGQDGPADAKHPTGNNRPSASSVAVLRQRVEAIGGKIIISGESSSRTELSLIVPFPVRDVGSNLTPTATLAP